MNAANLRHLFGTDELLSRGLVPPQDCPAPRAEAMTIPALMQRFGKFGSDIQKQNIEGTELDFSIRHPASIDKVRMIFAEVHDRLRLGFKAAFERSTGLKPNAATSSEKILSAVR